LKLVNGTIGVLGSVIAWVVAFVPLYVLLRWLVAQYRTRLYVRLQQMRIFQVIAASKVYNYYRLFRP